MASPSMLPSESQSTVKSRAQRALIANQRLQQSLSQRAGELEAEILESELLLKQLESKETDDDPEDEVQIPGASKPTGFLRPKEYLDSESPLHVDSVRRNEYALRITPHSMNPKELEALKLAVTDENRRIQAIRRQTGNVIPVDLESNVEGVDWNTVAEKVSDMSSVDFTAEECRIKWIGEQHPSINRGEWTSGEIRRLESLVTSAREKNPKGQLNWVDIAKELGRNRTPLDVMTRAVPRQGHRWDVNSDRKLQEGVAIYGINNWMSVARHVSPHATQTQCQNRYQKSIDPAIKRGAWTPQEDERLKKAVAALGSSWLKVAEFIPGRTNDQCNERWNEVLNTTAEKNMWSDQEDSRLLELVSAMGKQWRAISVQIGNGKTGPSCRIRFNKLSKKSPAPAPDASVPSTTYESPLPSSTQIHGPPESSTVAGTTGGDDLPTLASQSNDAHVPLTTEPIPSAIHLQTRSVEVLVQPTLQPPPSSIVTSAQPTARQTRSAAKRSNEVLLPSIEEQQVGKKRRTGPDTEPPSENVNEVHVPSSAPFTGKPRPKPRPVRKQQR